MRKHNRRGGSSIEVALSMPFFIAMTVAVLDVGVFFVEQSAVGDATRVACRDGSLVAQDDAVATAEATLAAVLDKRGYACGGGDCAIEATVDGGLLICTADVAVNGGLGIVPVVPDRVLTRSTHRMGVSDAP
jgi:Flp pilus assembly protein TadG